MKTKLLETTAFFPLWMSDAHGAGGTAATPVATPAATPSADDSADDNDSEASSGANDGSGGFSDEQLDALLSEEDSEDDEKPAASPTPPVSASPVPAAVQAAGTGTQPATTAPATPASATAVQPAPAATPTPLAATPAPVAAPAVGQQPAQTPAAQPAQQQPAAVDAAVVQAEYQKWRGEAETELATKHYVMPAELAEEMTTSPHTATPKLMARVYMDAVQASVGHMMTNLPRLIEATLEAIKGRDSDEEKFFGSWPKLDRNTHRTAIVQLGKAYRHSNPQASTDDFIRDVGAQAMVALKIPFEVTAGNGTGTVAAPPAQAGQAAFRPASGTRPAPAAAAPGAGNIFEQMSREMEAEDLNLGDD